MGLSQAISTAAAGLRTTQAGLSIVAGNVANVDTPGYVRKSSVQQATAAGDVGFSVRRVGINRELDQYLQRQLRLESSGASYANLRAQYYQRLQDIYGDPNSSTSLESAFGNFTGSMQALAANPSDYSTRSAAAASAQVLAQQLNGMTNDIQSLRGDTEAAISDTVRSVNDLLQQLARINTQVQMSGANDGTLASLLDQRDANLDKLAQLIDIRTTVQSNGEVTVFSGSGIQLVGTKAVQLTFQPQGTVNAQTQWDADPARRNLGTIMLMSEGGGIDMIASKAIRSGQLAALIDMRDNVLVEAQTQLDEFAAGMARLMSDRTTAGTPVSAGAQSGFDIDIGGLQAGNTVRVTYTDTTTGKHRIVSFVRVDSAAVLPLPDTATTDPNDKVVGVDFSQGWASVVSQINAGFNGRVQVTSPGGTTLRVLNDGPGNLATVNAVSVTETASSLGSGSPQLPLFVDIGTLFTGAFTTGGSQVTGFAGRITLNPAILADPAKLVQFASNTPNGDATRPDFIFRQLTSATQAFSPAGGVGSASAPFVGSLTSFLRQAMSLQGDAAAAAQNLSEGQQLVVNALQQRFTETSGVDIDREMSELLSLQTAYAANARVLSTIKEMMAVLMGT